MTLAIIQNILTRLLRIRRLVGLTLLTGMPAGVLFFVTFGNSPEDIRDIYAALNITVLMVIALPVAALVLASAAFGEERKHQTLPFLVVKPVPRSTIAAAVTGAAIVATLVVGGLGVAAGWVVAAVAVRDATIGVSAAVGLALAAVGYGAVFVPLGLLVGRSTLAGLAFVFVWESIIGTFVSGVSSFSIYRTALSALADTGTISTDSHEILTEMLGNVAPGVGGATAKIAVVLLLSVALTTWILRYRDLAGE